MLYLFGISIILCTFDDDVYLIATPVDLIVFYFIITLVHLRVFYCMLVFVHLIVIYLIVSPVHLIVFYFMLVFVHLIVFLFDISTCTFGGDLFGICTFDDAGLFDSRTCTFDGVLFDISIFTFIQVIWYKHIFIHPLQQHKNNIVVQWFSYYGHIWMVKQLTTLSPKTADISIPFCHIHGIAWCNCCIMHVCLY